METDLRTLTDRLKDMISDEKIAESRDGISLLDLKNEALLAYLNDLAIVVGAKLNGDRATRIKATKGTIEQRVTLEKGIKGLEAKVTYQIDKALRAYKREQDQQKQTEKNAGEDQSDDDDDSSDDSSDDDLTAYKPNVSALKNQDESEDEGESAKYTAPKIAKTAIPTKERKHKRRDFAMEEFLKEQEDAPTAEPSIGAAIMDGGRGGQSTEHERRKEREIQEFEEANFTRIGTHSGKKLRKEAAKRQRDAMSRTAFGENWDFLGKDGGNQKERKRSKRR